MISYPTTYKREIIYFGILAAISLGVYILVSSFTYRIGFPLDDAWIHQTYARNLGLRGEWAYVPGEPSAGSTAPLWSGLLAIGYFLHLRPYLWTYLLGWGLLVTMAFIGSYLFKVLSPGKDRWIPWAGVLLIIEWHLVWAGISGMETLLFALISLIVITWLIAGLRYWIGLGLFIGVSVWVRPDGVTLLGPAMFVILLSELPFRQKYSDLAKLGIGFLVVFSLYLLFNQSIAGEWWPNTFYAKQAEYAVELQDPIWWRILEQVSMPIIGVGIVLLPGFIFNQYWALKTRRWEIVAGDIWAIGYLLLYAYRLPVTFQHGRYVIPMMPVFFIIGFAGMASWIQLKSSMTIQRVVSRIWLLSTILVLIAFWVLGARVYARDVAVIESEMVNIAKWITENTESDALIAAHDIGALGYFGERQILDLAGLVSPEVIPFIWNESKLANYMDERGANYLVTFPMWYPSLVVRGEPIYDSNGIFTVPLGGENMVVYRWKSPTD